MLCFNISKFKSGQDMWSASTCVADTRPSHPLIRAKRSTGILLCEAQRLPPLFLLTGGCDDRKETHQKGQYTDCCSGDTGRKSHHRVLCPANRTEYFCLFALARSGLCAEKHYGLWQSHGACTYQWWSGALGRVIKTVVDQCVRTAQFGESTVRAVLARIEDTQSAMLEIMKVVVMPRAER